MNLIREKERQRLHARLTAETEANRKTMQSAWREYEQACEGSAFREARWEKRAALCGVSVDSLKARVCPLKVRRVHAKLQKSLKCKALLEASSMPHADVAPKKASYIDHMKQ